MKKIIFCMMALFTAMLFADEVAKSYSVYDFKASFKRIEPVLTTFKATDVNPRHLSYIVANDTIKGYLVLPECCDAIEGGACVACGDVSGFGLDADGESVAYFYIVRGGEKYETASLIRVKADAIYATVFGRGANSAYIDSDKENEVFKKIKNASLTMTCTFPEDMFETKGYPTNLPTIGMRNLDYGFLGFTCLDGLIVFTGFGNATPTVKSKNDVAFCGGSVKVAKCIKITSISGTLTGMFNYGNAALCEDCDEFAMTDPCDYYSGRYKAPVSGTWTLKYNGSFSAKKVLLQEDIEAILMKAMKKNEILDLEESDSSEEGGD